MSLIQACRGILGGNMVYKFVIDGRMPGINELIAYNRTNIYKGAALKKNNEHIAMLCINKQIGNLHIYNPVVLHYMFVEPNTKRDHDNVASFAMKVIQDALVRCGVLENDGWKNIHGFTCDFAVDKKKPRIEVTIEEIE